MSGETVLYIAIVLVAIVMLVALLLRAESAIFAPRARARGEGRKPADGEDRTEPTDGTAGP